MPAKRTGFTLVELMAAMAVSILLMALLFGALEQLSRTAKRASGSATAFDEARIAFANLSLGLSQATLSPYWNVSYDSAGKPYAYSRMSDLHFLCGPASDLIAGRQVSGDAVFFQAPAGFDPQSSTEGTELNGLGYFVEYRDINADSPLSSFGLLPAKWRFQLREFRQPASQLKIFDPQASSSKAWFTDVLSKSGAPVTTLGNNIALLIVRVRSIEKSEETAYYSYDSRSWAGTGPQPASSHQLPQVADVLMLALDAQLAERISTGETMPSLVPANTFIDPSQFDGDAGKLEASLAGTYPQAGYRIFRGTVALRAAKWSTTASQTP